LKLYLFVFLAILDTTKYTNIFFVSYPNGLIILEMHMLIAPAAIEVLRVIMMNLPKEVGVPYDVPHVPMLAGIT
jgi:hypothetical protein